jgi:hypothetical protein
MANNYIHVLILVVCLLEIDCDVIHDKYCFPDCCIWYEEFPGGNQIYTQKYTFKVCA